MNKFNFRLGDLTFLSLALPLLLSCPLAGAADNECATSGDYAFVCGPKSAEDLVLVPDTKWIIASGFAKGAAIYLINSQQKTWTELYPGDAPLARQNMQVYGACSGPPDPNGFVTHGLNIRRGAAGHSTLFVVGHGGREAIEVFDVNATGKMPVLTWTGCILTPASMEANSVASLRDGSLLVTIPLRTGRSISEALAGSLTGGVYKWSPGDTGFTPVQGTDLPYANGIEASADEQEFYVVSSGLFTVTAFSNTSPARALRSSKPLAVVPDNLHWSNDGKLITAGLSVLDPVCGDVPQSQAFDLTKFASCPRPFAVLAIDPQSMESTTLASGPAIESFSNITMGLPVGGELWIGTFGGDRVAYRRLKQ